VTEEVPVLLELLGKAVGGGVFVVLFAAFAQTLSPKRFAGVFAGVPTVAVASLLVTTAAKGPKADAVACTGMIAGALGLLAYCLAAPKVLPRLGTIKGSAVTLAAWLTITGLALPAVATAPAASSGTVLVPMGRSASARRPRLGIDLGKLREGSPGEFALRFAFGAGTSVLAGLVSRLVDPLAGGAFLAFPAVLLASLTLVADEEGQQAARDDARGAAAGAIGMVAFAAVGGSLFGTVPTAAAFVLSAATWLVVALTAYGVAWLTGHGDDEPSGVTE
jgi:uncharacterized membrane protein (GlpM family)